ALLVGLSAARNALPGDTFQLVPRPPVTVSSVGPAIDQSPANRTGGYAFPRDGDADNELVGQPPVAGEAAPAMAFAAIVRRARSGSPVIEPRRCACRAPPSVG